MATSLLVIIYIAFISLGLPDAILGAGWPVMQKELAVPFSFAGLISMIISGGTIASSIFSAKILKRFGNGKVAAFSVGLTAVALLGLSFVPSFWWILLLAIPLGLGAGAVDSGLNTYVSEHYESRHMSWLHSFWGLGALSGPFVLSAVLANDANWRIAYFAISIFQILLVIVLILAVPLWSKVPKRAEHANLATETKPQRLFAPLKLKGASLTLLAFLVYCGIESSMGLWGGSFLTKVKGLDAQLTATWVALFFASITLGRFITGFITFTISNKDLIRYGGLIILLGVVLMILPLSLFVSLVGFLLVGFGCAPLFPCMLHETPSRFGIENSSALMGFQMAVAYIGASLLPPIFGALASESHLYLLPWVLLGYGLIFVLSSELVRKKVSPS